MDGCSNHYCYLTGTRKGMCTNSICNCLNELPLRKRRILQARINNLEKSLNNIINIIEEYVKNPEDTDIIKIYNDVKKIL